MAKIEAEWFQTSLKDANQAVIWISSYSKKCSRCHFLLDYPSDASHNRQCLYTVGDEEHSRSGPISEYASENIDMTNEGEHPRMGGTVFFIVHSSLLHITS